MRNLRETWGPAWFATALCAIVLVVLIFAQQFEIAAPAFFCFLPIVFFQLSKTIDTLAKRVEELERAQQGGAGG